MVIFLATKNRYFYVESALGTPTVVVATKRVFKPNNDFFFHPNHVVFVPKPNLSEAQQCDKNESKKLC